MGVTISREGPRGCGYRKVGGTYLVCDGPGHPCEILPLELHVCSTCGQGIKPARGWTWINPREMFQHERCPKCNPYGLGFTQSEEGDAPIKCRFIQVQKAGLIWIGEQFYPTPADFNREADGMGVSRRITCVPRGFVLGESWVLLAHRKVDFYDKIARKVEQTDQAFVMVDSNDDHLRPGIFTAFLPSRIEKIVDEKATETDIRQIEEDGMTPVQVVRLGENQDLFEDGDENEE
ncbi:MAG: hypothetical protein KAT00_04735 [Planctomycetes bacterium]|nr:hypothetical protein [Planctomycetota bacterium]